MKDFLRAAKIPLSVRLTQWDKNILVENEATENSKATIQRNRFSDGQGARTERKGHWRQRRQCDDRDASKQRTTHIQVLVIATNCKYNGGHDSREPTLRLLLCKKVNQQRRTCRGQHVKELLG